MCKIDKIIIKIKRMNNKKNKKRKKERKKKNIEFINTD